MKNVLLAALGVAVFITGKVIFNEFGLLGVGLYSLGVYIAFFTFLFSRGYIWKFIEFTRFKQKKVMSNVALIDCDSMTDIKSKSECMCLKMINNRYATDEEYLGAFKACLKEAHEKFMSDVPKALVARRIRDTETKLARSQNFEGAKVALAKGIKPSCSNCVWLYHNVEWDFVECWNKDALPEVSKLNLGKLQHDFHCNFYELKESVLKNTD